MECADKFYGKAAHLVLTLDKLCDGASSFYFSGKKPGVCPKIQILGVCEELCSQDGDCLNDEKCCSNGCGHQCMAPSKGTLY
uniref:WAP domain-containing protein n=1 Tax=Cyprinus carpio TaxID=7962 RepID=A0A8C2EGJ2_CYPCA